MSKKNSEIIKAAFECNVDEHGKKRVRMRFKSNNDHGESYIYSNSCDYSLKEVGRTQGLKWKEMRFLRLQCNIAEDALMSGETGTEGLYYLEKIIDEKWDNLCSSDRKAAMKLEQEFQDSWERREQELYEAQTKH